MKLNRPYKNSLFIFIIYTALFFLIIPLLISTISFKRDSPTIKDITYLNTMQVSINESPWEDITLPHVFKNLKPGSQLSFKAVINPGINDGVYISSNYSKADVYFNDSLVFKFGKESNYPFFMTNPAKEIHVIETHKYESPVKLQINYILPDKCSRITVDAPMIGSSKEIILERAVKYGYSWVFALTQIVGGMSLICISFYLIFVDKKGKLFIWLGLFAVSSGLWFFGSNNFSITVFPNSTWLYLSSYLGFAFCMMPLLRFIIHSVDFENPKPLFIMEGIYGLIFLVSILLQLLRITPLHISWYLFRILIPLYLFIMILYALYEHIKWKNRNASRFLVPLFILFVSSSLEMLKQLTCDYIVYPTLLFQCGIFIFHLMMGIFTGIAFKDNLKLKKLEEDLNHKQNMIDMITEEQREQSMTLAENETALSRQRHDLRHHIAMIMELSEGNKELQEYLSTLMEKIPSKKEHYCENEIVNAIVSHYAYLCESNDIQFDSNLTVPSQKDVSLNSDLCVIFANLLENAYEACMRINSGQDRFIIIKSSLNRKLLTITMDNSFNGDVTKIGDKYRSAKRNDYGIGLASIKSISQQYHGDSTFTNDNNIFFSSVYLSIY